MTVSDFPALYISHGAPMLLDDDLWVSQLADWAKTMPKPKAILIVSAHWESAPISISSTAANTPLIYDFGGFDPKFYQMTYNTPDASWLGDLVAKLMPDTEPLHQHSTRGLDHGAWVPLRVMYPDADIPVLQLSMPTHDPVKLLSLGARLRSLREEGVLVIGSSEFDLWAAEALAAGDLDTLIDYRNSAPGMPYAHPTVEHFTPLFISLGAATRPDAAIDTKIDGYFMGLAKRSFEVG